MLKVRYRKKHNTEVQSGTIFLTLPKESRGLPTTARFRTRNTALRDKPVINCWAGNTRSPYILQVARLGSFWTEDSYVALLHFYSFCIPKSDNTKDMLTLQTSPQCEIASSSCAARPCKHGAWRRLRPVLRNCTTVADHGKRELCHFYTTITKWWLQPASVAASWPFGHFMYVCMYTVCRQQIVWVRDVSLP